MKETSFGFAVVGLGMGAARAREVAATPGARLVAVADIDPQRAEAVAAEHGCEWTMDYHALLERKDVDVVYILTPNGLHGQMVAEAARAGKHAITTKPMETTLEKADAMIAACQKAGVRLVVDFEMRYSPAVNKIRAALQRELFGRLILGEARLKWWRDDSYYQGWHGTWELDGGGSLMTQTIHQIDVLCWLMGPPQTVCGRIGVYDHQIETEDMGMAMIHYADGAEGLILGTTTFPEELPARVEIHGTQGGVILEDVNHIVFWKTAGHAEVEELPHPASATDDMIKSLRHDTKPFCSGREGRKSLALVRAIYDSALNGQKTLTFAGW